MRTLIEIIAVLLGLLLLLLGIRQAQLGPHRIVHSVMGRVVSDYWTTNPVVYRYYSATNLGAKPEDVICETQMLWTVWPIFRK
jgi:hypothetical protein